MTKTETLSAHERRRIASQVARLGAEAVAREYDAVAEMGSDPNGCALMRAMSAFARSLAR